MFTKYSRLEQYNGKAALTIKSCKDYRKRTRLSFHWDAFGIKGMVWEKTVSANFDGAWWTTASVCRHLALGYHVMVTRAKPRQASLQAHMPGVCRSPCLGSATTHDRFADSFAWVCRTACLGLFWPAPELCWPPRVPSPYD